MKKILIFLTAICFSGTVFGQANIAAGGTWATARGIINSNFLLMAPKANPTFSVGITTPSITIGAVTITANGQELNILDGALITVAELNRLVGVTSAIQTQLNGKSATSHNHTGTYEPALGNPIVNGYVLSSNTTGARAWIEMTGGTGSSDGLNLGGGTLELIGADAIQFISTNNTSLTLPTTGVLATTQNISDSILTRLSQSSVVVALADSNKYEYGYATPHGVDLQIAASGGSMTYPTAGIPLSTGSTWGTSITDNSTNWNTAYSHTSSTSNPHSVTASQVNLGNVTNESKTTMFTSPVFTGTIPKYSTTDTLALKSDVRGLFIGAELGLGVADSSVNKGYAAFYATTQSLLGKENSLGNPVSNGYVLSSTTSGTRSWIEMTGGGVSSTDVRNIVADSLNFIRSNSVQGLSLADSNKFLNKNYATPRWVDSLITANGAGADSAVYVTVTRLRDSLNDIRILVNSLIEAVAGIGIDIVPPYYSAAEIGLKGSNKVGIKFTEAMIDSLPASSAFSLTENGDAFAITSIAFGATGKDSVYITTTADGVFGNEYRLAYTAPSVQPLQDSAFNHVPSFTNKLVTNNVAEVVEGVELIVNGGFDSDVSWEVGSQWSIAGGVATYANGGYSNIQQLPENMVDSLHVSTDYTIAFDAIASGGGLAVRISSGSHGDIGEQLIAIGYYTTGSYSLNFTTPGTLTRYGIAFYGIIDGGGSIDNVSLKTR